MENITIAKSRKSGKWEIIAQPGEAYDKHLQTYRKIAEATPVSDEWERVIIGRIQPTSPMLNLITAAQSEATRATQSAALNRVQDAVEDAQKRQAARDLGIKQIRDADHAKALAAKNSIVASVQADNKAKEETKAPAAAKK